MTAPEQPPQEPSDPTDAAPVELDPSFLTDDELALIALWLMQDD